MQMEADIISEKLTKSIVERERKKQLSDRIFAIILRVFAINVLSAHCRHIDIA